MTDLCKSTERVISPTGFVGFFNLFFLFSIFIWIRIWLRICLSAQIYFILFLCLKIVFPTGTSVKAYLFHSWYWESGKFWYVNVEVYPTIADFESTTGLCGYLDHDQTNDLTWNTGFEDDIQLYDYNNRHPDKFSQSWG